MNFMKSGGSDSLFGFRSRSYLRSTLSCGSESFLARGLCGAACRGSFKRWEEVYGADIFHNTTAADDVPRPPEVTAGDEKSG